VNFCPIFTFESVGSNDVYTQCFPRACADKLCSEFSILVLVLFVNLNIPFTVQETKSFRVLIIEQAEGATGSDKEVFSAEEGIVVVQNNGSDNPTEDAHDVLGVNDDSAAGDSHCDGIR
jgi:hypothetical protein